MTQLFSNKQRFGNGQPVTPLDQLVGEVQKQLNLNGTSFATSKIAKAALSMEGLDATTMVELNSSADQLNHALESIASTHGLSLKLTKAQRDAATVAGIIASDIPAFLNTPVKRDVISQENMSFIPAPGMGDFFDSRMKAALEAYDEKENKNAVVYSVAYNLQAARQDEFGETFFPTVVVTPDQVGFGVSIRLISVYNEVRRQTTGNVDNFGKRNIIQAVIDPTILRNDQIKIVPIVRPESVQHFVDPALLPPRNVVFEGENITTSALAMGKTFSLLAVSQTEALLDTGLLDSTDSIDTAIVLKKLYMKAGDDVIGFNTDRLATAVFTYAMQGNYRQMNLAFTTSSLLVTKDSKLVDGTALADLAPITVGEFAVRLGVSVSGSVNLETATTNIFSSTLTVSRVSDKDGNDLDLTVGQGKAIADLFIGATMLGYELEAQRTNLNRRQRGQLLDTTYYNQVYAVPLRSPITIPRPLTIGDANDSSDLAALITATHIRTSNAAVDELLRVKDILAEFVNANDAFDANPEILGVSRFLIKPHFEAATIDVDVVIDSVKSHERAADIQAVLVNKLRDMAYRMYRDSGYKAAADALAGGVSQVPTIIIGTDPVISRYLTVTGDLRTLGNDFNVKIVSTLNMRMTGKIVMTFGQDGSGTEGVPNPMHFGNMAWKPELTLVLPLHRNGANSKELTVQPSFLHITNLPIMCSIEVKGLKEVSMLKVPVNMHPVP